MIKPIPHHPDYSVSDEGRVFGPRGELKGSLRPDGYRNVNLRGKVRLVHHLVLEAFDGPRPPGMVGRHGDGNRDNNRLSNLSWSTQADNLSDTVAHGTKVQGSKQGSSKLTESDVLAMVFQCKAGRTYGEVAKEFKVSRSTVSYIMLGKTWKHVTGGVL